LSFEQFEQLHDDGLKHQLLEGELLVVAPPKTPHTLIAENLADALRPYVKAHFLGRVHVEAGFKLSTATWLQPEVSFVRNQQVQQSDPTQYYSGSPAIAIEVASESNTAAELDRKMELYFSHGAEEVWVVYPETRRIRIHLPDGTSRTAGDPVQSDSLPGWSAAPSAIFET
ncbi:MAG TPA: Uma2 family endonuclease, partial [Bryobacteraceae bacterium]|nr:Uma2 family endonuclease [Bryobacteraceae bacterium]